MNRFLALGATAACSVSALAFATDCRNPTTLAEKKNCASKEYDAADKELNAVWPLAQAYMKYVDSNGADPVTPLPEDATPAAKLLTIAQRAWISHRDLDCAASAASSSGASDREVFKLQCLGEKTRARADELRKIHADTAFLDMTEDVRARFEEVKWSLPGCEDQVSSLGWNRCMNAVFDVGDRNFNYRYRVVKSALARYPGAVNSLVSSERAWITIRDNDCEAVAREMYASTSYPAFGTVCHIRKTIERTFELQARFPAVIE